jgi:hypothetical protein
MPALAGTLAAAGTTPAIAVTQARAVSQQYQVMPNIAIEKRGRLMACPIATVYCYDILVVFFSFLLLSPIRISEYGQHYSDLF